LRHAKYRNDIELFSFDPNGPSFGIGGAVIVDVRLLDHEGSALQWCVGGEEIVIHVRCEARDDLFKPIVGFYVKDRLGQTLFGDNTYLTHLANPVRTNAGEKFDAIFNFHMPILSVGDYSICVAVAEGTQMEHVQHHWIHDAILFKSHSSTVCTGLVGIPMQRIELRGL
jgi:lipopolysaccharide transport system ATP-binding protein